MCWIKRQNVIRLVFAIFISSILYVITCLSLFLTAFVALKNDFVFESGLLNKYQSYLYFGGLRNIWQAQPECIDFDPDLLYKPKIGTCTFSNPEFKTILKFDEEGRLGTEKHESFSGPGIAVLGDSHAMGWGVEDHQTFSAILEKTTKRPVFNLAVSSYGTYRELLRLEKSGLLPRIDTIIIQYCDNDLSENLQAAKEKRHYEEHALEKHVENHQPQALPKWKEWVKFSLKGPVELVRTLLNDPVAKPESFEAHFHAFDQVTRRFPWLASKNVIVFYSNAFGSKFSGFSDKHITKLPNLKFIELETNRSDYFFVDDHPTPAGHLKIAQSLNRKIYP